MTRQSKSTWLIVLLVACAGGLVVAFATLPAVICRTTTSAGSRYHTLPASLPAAATSAFVDYLRQDAPTFSPDLELYIDYWRVWHASKVIISGLLVIVLVLLAMAVWHRYLNAPRRHSSLAWAAGVVSVVAVAAGGVLAANIQSTAAPSIALWPMLTEYRDSSEVAGTFQSLKERLPGAASSESRWPALDTLIEQARVYQWTMVASLLLLTAMTFALFVAGLRLRATSPPGSRSRTTGTTLVCITFAASSLYLGLAFASMMSALNPADALMDALGIS